MNTLEYVLYDMISYLCPLCRKESTGLCEKCLALLKEEMLIRYLHGYCRVCGSYLIHENSVCTCRNSTFHLTVFRKTIVVSTFFDSVEKGFHKETVRQIGEVLLPFGYALTADDSESDYFPFLVNVCNYVNGFELCRRESPSFRFLAVRYPSQQSKHAGFITFI